MVISVSIKTIFLISTSDLVSTSKLLAYEAKVKFILRWAIIWGVKVYFILYTKEDLACF